MPNAHIGYFSTQAKHVSVSLHAAVATQADMATKGILVYLYAETNTACLRCYMAHGYV